MNVLVLGSTGNVGPHVVTSLLQIGAQVRVLVRDAEKARSILPEGVEVLEGSFEDGNAVAKATSDVSSIFLLTPHSYYMADVELRIIRELRRTEVKIVKLSGTSSAIRPDGPHATREHWEVETVLRNSGQRYAILRPNAFMQTMINQIMLPSIKATGKVMNPIGDVGLSMIDAQDIGQVAARVLTQETWDGETLVLTGPRAVTYVEIAGHIGEIRGEAIEMQEITPEDVKRSSLERGLAPWEAGHFQEIYQMIRDGGSEYVTDDVECVTGAKPRDIREYLEDNEIEFAR